MTNSNQLSNTLIDRCMVAYAEAVRAASVALAARDARAFARAVRAVVEANLAAETDWAASVVASQGRRCGVAAVLEHLAAEILVMNQRNPRLTVHELARSLTIAASGEIADCDQKNDHEDDWQDHPSLSAKDRNPSLK